MHLSGSRYTQLCLPNADTTNNFEAHFVSEDWQFHPHQPISHDDCSQCITLEHSAFQLYLCIESIYCDLQMIP